MPQQYAPLSLDGNRSLFTNLALLIFLAILGISLGQSIATLLCPFATNSVETAMDTALRQPLLVLQATTATGAFILPPLVYLRFFTSQTIRGWFQLRQPYLPTLLLTLGLVLSFMAANAWFVQWNAMLKLPAWLKAFEVWAQERESVAQSAIDLLTTFHSLPALGVAILVMAVIPAIGEELLFRGLVQHLFLGATKNIHFSIAMSALLFSAVHVQFYGFVPRFLLGTLFGYIYWWTKDLLFPMVAHFINNAFILLVLFLHQRGIIAQDITTMQAPPVPVVLLFGGITLALAICLRQRGKCAR